MPDSCQYCFEFRAHGELGMHCALNKRSIDDEARIPDWCPKEKEREKDNA